MKQKIILLLIVAMFVATTSASAHRSPLEVRDSYEKMLFEGGYKTIDDAVIECEKHFNRNIELPLRLPPVEFSHAFGQCVMDKEYNVNDHLAIEYVGDSHSVNAKNHYWIDIRPIDQKLKRILREHQIIHTYKLEDGTKALYGTMGRGFASLLVFEKRGWQYLLRVDKRIEEHVPADVLVDIANSIGLGERYKQKPRNELLR